MQSLAWRVAATISSPGLTMLNGCFSSFSASAVGNAKAAFTPTSRRRRPTACRPDHGRRLKANCLASAPAIAASTVPQRAAGFIPDLRLDKPQSAVVPQLGLGQQRQRDQDQPTKQLLAGAAPYRWRSATRYDCRSRPRPDRRECVAQRTGRRCSRRFRADGRADRSCRSPVYPARPPAASSRAFPAAAHSSSRISDSIRRHNTGGCWGLSAGSATQQWICGAASRHNSGTDGRAMKPFCFSELHPGDQAVRSASLFDRRTATDLIRQSD